MGDKYYSRSAPRKYTQTKATKARAKVFGKASGIGAQIREGLSSVIPNSSDRKMHGLLVARYLPGCKPCRVIVPLKKTMNQYLILSIR